MSLSVCVCLSVCVSQCLVFGRNMDWPSFGVVGSHTLIINRKYTNGKHSTAEVGIPGFVGTLTGMNKHGLSVAMNVCARGYHHEGGIPATIYNRMVLERSKTVRDASYVISRNNPLGSYHLNVADKHTAQSTHFYQGVFGRHVTRYLSSGKPLITTNCSYGTSGSRYDHMHHSAERREVLDRYFSGAKASIHQGGKQLHDLVSHSLSLTPVNNVITTHRVVMVPEKRQMRVAFDNTFAGSQPLQDLDLRKL